MRPVSFVADEQALLSLWERALPLPGAAREALLAHDDAAAPAATVGSQRLRLIERLHQRVGARFPLTSRCPACGEDAAFAVDSAALLDALTPVSDAPTEHALDHDGWRVRFRLPAPHEIEVGEHGLDADADAFVQRLLECCVIDVRDHGALCAVSALPEPVLAALSLRMDALDPAAHIGFELDCPACQHHWTAPFDPGRALWSLLQRDAERLLLDIDDLAQRYGWSEHQILALTPTRRQAYLQLARAG